MIKLYSMNTKSGWRYDRVKILLRLLWKEPFNSTFRSVCSGRLQENTATILLKSAFPDAEQTDQNIESLATVFLSQNRHYSKRFHLVLPQTCLSLLPPRKVLKSCAMIKYCGSKLVHRFNREESWCPLTFLKNGLYIRALWMKVAEKWQVRIMSVH